MTTTKRLEAALAALLALRQTEHLPDASRMRWLRAVPRILVQFALDEDAHRWPEPSAARLAIMTETLAALDELRIVDSDAFEAVLMTSLVHPRTGAQLMTENDVARALAVHPTEARARVRRGVNAVATLLHGQATIEEAA